MPTSKTTPLKALSVAQPWAECIVSKGKNVENRSWNTSFRGYFAIHASASIDFGRFETCEEEYGVSLDPETVSLGAIVGFANLVEVVTERELSPKTKKWFMVEHGFVLENVIRLKKPVKVKGALSFWEIPAAAKKACLAQMTSAQRKAILENPIMKKNVGKPSRAPGGTRVKVITVGGLKIYADPKFKGFKP